MYWKHLFPTFFAQQTSRNELEGGEREKDIENNRTQTSDVGTTLIVKGQCGRDNSSFNRLTTTSHCLTAPLECITAN